MTDTYERRSEPGGMAVGLTLFAGCMLLIVGFFQFMEGLVALFNDEFFVVGKEYVFSVDLTVYGWVHLLVGILLAAVGAGVMTGKTWGRYVGIGVAALSMIANFFFIPYYPVWSLLIIGLNVAVIWALSQRALS